MKLRKIALAVATSVVAALCLASPAKVLFGGMQKHQNNIKKDREKIPDIKISIDGTGLRLAEVKLNIHKNSGVQTQSSYLQGQVSFVGSRKTKHPAAASIIGNKVRITFPGKVTGSRQTRQRTYVIEVPFRSGNSILTGRVKSVPASAHSHKSCAGEYEEHASSKVISAVNESLPTNTTKVATIHTYADAEFVQVYGSQANDEILDYVNTAEAFYTNQLGISFRVVGQSTLTTDPTELLPGNILANFRNDTSTQDPNVDLKHLFTGKEMTGSTVGLAFVSAICREPNYSYGITQHYYGGLVTPYILAHELGHNFGGSHDVVTRSIMYPTIQTFSGVKFSDQSVNEISSYLNQFDACLSVERSGPDLRAATLTVGRISRMLYVVLKSQSGTIIPNQPIILYVNGAPKSLVTDDRGRARFIIRSRRGGRFVAFAQTPGAEVTSQAIKFRLR